MLCPSKKHQFYKPFIPAVSGLNLPRFEVIYDILA